MKLAIIIPAYNEATVIGEVIKAIPERFKEVDDFEIIVVNDQSIDETARIAKSVGATVLSHRLNLGVGGATLTGLEYASRNDFDIAVTMDADGQHDPTEIHKLIEKVKSGHDLVIGSRLIEKSRAEMPKIKWIGNNFFNIITFLYYRTWVTDSQSGFRAFSKEAIQKCRTGNAGYEICTEMIGRAKRAGLIISEVPIRVIYTDYSKRKGQHYLNGFNIIIKLALSKLRGNL